jgi:hypothetical protein
MITRTSEQVTSTVRETRMACDGCGFSCVAQLSIILTVRASERPNPDIRLPFSSKGLADPRHRSPLRPANDIAPAPANDDAVLPPAAATIASG